ncbi:MAG: hypothetical protein IKZ58_03410 [Selenomonadaceae bacterium]|nr:hypothetical protein [Selenomonadaceae bacterium]
MNKRKKKKLRNKFTDALGEEMAARKALDLGNMEKGLGNTSETKKAATEIAEYKVENPPAVEVEKVEEVKPVEEVKNVEDVKPVEVKVDAEFEKRVLAEADNHFHDEKIKRPKRKITSEGRIAPPRPTFRTKTMIEKLDEKSLEDKKSSDEDADLRRKLTRAEIAGATLSAVMLIYSIMTYDKPLFFLATSVIAHTLRPLIGAFFGKHNRAVQNALRGFSIALFFGALLFLFI